MRAKTTAVCLMLLLLSACSSTLKPVLKSNVKTIELANIEAHELLLIRQVNPAVAIMGTSGLVMDAAIITQRAMEYEESAGPVRNQSIQSFADTLIRALSKKGFQITASGKDYWDYFRGERKKNNGQIDGILNIELKHLGFWSAGPMEPYTPSVFVLAELIEPSSRKILYSDRFVIGIDITSLQVMELAFGQINMLATTKKPSAFTDFHALVRYPQLSRKALIKTMERAARHVATGLQGDRRAIARAYAQTRAQRKLATTNHQIIAVDIANIRSGPSLNSKIVGKLRKGDSAPKLRHQGDWFYVHLEDGKKGWLHNSVLLKRKVIHKTKGKVLPKGVLVVTVNRANIRNRPDTNSKVVGRLKKGASVTRLRKQGKWYYIRLENGNKAWAHQLIFRPM
ncbi:MAG: SH3 domain-containing protein [Mariprofundus sp.]